MGRAHGPGVFEAERADDRLDEAEVGQDEASNAEASGVFKTVAGFPTGVAQVGGAGGAVGLAVEDALEPSVNQPFFTDM